MNIELNVNLTEFRAILNGLECYANRTKGSTREFVIDLHSVLLDKLPSVMHKQAHTVNWK